jgi:hypothetical protein
MRGNGATVPDSVTLGASNAVSAKKRLIMQRTLILSVLAASGLLLSACASSTPAGLQEGQTVAIVNSLSWDNPLNGKRDGVRTSWPVKHGTIAAEYFPLAQLKQCDAGGKSCAWGVMRAAQRAHAGLRGGRRRPDAGRGHRRGAAPGCAPGRDADGHGHPAGCGALVGKKQVQPSWKLKYGKVEQIDLDYGVRYQVCVQRYDAAGKAIDSCDIPFI